MATDQLAADRAELPGYVRRQEWVSRYLPRFFMLSVEFLI